MFRCTIVEGSSDQPCSRQIKPICKQNLNKFIFDKCSPTKVSQLILRTTRVGFLIITDHREHQHSFTSAPSSDGRRLKLTGIGTAVEPLYILSCHWVGLGRLSWFQLSLNLYLFMSTYKERKIIWSYLGGSVCSKFDCFLIDWSWSASWFMTFWSFFRFSHCTLAKLYHEWTFNNKLVNFGNWFLCQFSPKTSVE